MVKPAVTVKPTVVVKPVPIVSSSKPVIPVTPVMPTSLLTTLKKSIKMAELGKKVSRKKEIVALPMSVKLNDDIKVIDTKTVESADSVVADSAVEPRLTSAPESSEESPVVVGSTNGSTSGYGSEGYASEEDKKQLKAVETTLDYLDIRDEQTHCARCHKSYDPQSCSNAEKRCLLPHPTKMVIPIRRDGDGTHFVCLCCRTEFKLPKMTFYEAGVNSMLTGYCFIGQHTSDEDDIDYQYDGGAALSCEEAGCIEFFV